MRILTVVVVIASFLLTSCGAEEPEDVQEGSVMEEGAQEEQDRASEQEGEEDTLRPEEIPGIFRKYLPPEALENIPRPKPSLPPVSLPERPDISDAVSLDEIRERLIESIAVPAAGRQ